MLPTALPWAALLALGAVHGINPAMGWLFAVGRGLHERDGRAVWRALGPLAAGHALAIAAAVLLAAAFGQVLPVRGLRWLLAVALLLVGGDALRRHRHVTFGGMNKSPSALATWSFLVATAHGAGLMVLPFMLGTGGAPSAAHGHHGAVSPALSGAMAAGPAALAAPVVHTLGYIAVTALLAVVVYEKVGLRILTRAWINLHVIWALALIAAGALSLPL